MHRDRELSRAIWMAVASRVHRDVREILDPLAPDQLADLYIWLVGEFPTERSRGRSGWVGSDESIVDFRDAVLVHLRQRGDPRCLAAIDRVVKALPHVPHLKLHRVLARRAIAQKAWVPVEPHTLDRLVRDERKCVVESEAQLLAVVLESLDRFEASLHGELSAVRDLWDKGEGEIWRPVDEAALSNRIARHLRDDLQDRGIIVNREVKIRQGLPGTSGQQTDIYVDAVSSKTPAGVHERLSVVIEVKGCWNSGVLEAMKTQLVDRYLRDNKCAHGLYLVGWFIGDGWSDSDGRKAAAQRVFPDPLDTARADLQAQAEALSRDGKTVRSFILDARTAKT
jgi:hypothetical protein